jgi:hypothetical protein
LLFTVSLLTRVPLSSLTAFLFFAVLFTATWVSALP